MNVLSPSFVLSRLIFLVSLFSFPVYAITFTVNTTDDAIDIIPGDGVCKTVNDNCSLRAAVMESNVLSGADTVSLPAGIYTLSIGNTNEDAAAEGDLDILDDTRIEGAGSSLTTISGGGIFGVFSILPPTDSRRIELNIKNVTITDSFRSETNSGSAISSYGVLFLDNISINKSAKGNFAITNIETGQDFSGYLQILNSKINDNDRAIYTKNTVFNIKDSEIKRNINTIKILDPSFASTGAGITADNSRITIENVAITDNIALEVGGGISAVWSFISISKSEISNNSAIDNILMNDSWGGGLNLLNSSVTITKSNILNNKASVSGGAIYSSNGNLTIKKSTIAGNQSDRGGAGILYIGSSPEDTTAKALNISNSIISKNLSPTGVGGGFFVLRANRSDNQVLISNTEISENVAKNGAGLAYLEDGTLTILNSTISGNNASDTGGGIEISQLLNGSTNIKNSTIANNSAISGANIFSNAIMNTSTVSISNTIIANGINSANCNRALNSLTNNLDTDDSCGLDATQNDVISADVKLGSLDFNGGFSRNHTLLDGSLAIDAGDDIVCQSLDSIDQRYFYRGNSVCDIGAVESNAELAKSGEIIFEVDKISTSEDSSSVTFKVKRINAAEGRVSVSVFSTTTSTATIRDDYLFNSSTLVWEDGNMNDKLLTVLLVNNDVNEEDKTIIISMNNPTNNVKLVPDQVLTITILDDESPGEINFSQTEYTVNESKATVLIAVERTKGTSGDITFKMDTGKFEAGEIEVTLLNGQRSFVFELNIEFAQDNYFDGDESFLFTILSVSGGATIGAIATTTLVIEDNETLPTNPGSITFSKSDYSIDENDGSILVDIVRNDGQEGNVYFDFEIINGTAEFNLDFGNINASAVKKARVLFAVGEKSKTIQILILNDDLVEENESFQLAISNPLGGATIGKTSSTTITIIDDEIGSAINAKPISSDKKSGSGSINGVLIFSLLLIMLAFRWPKTSKFSVTRRKFI